jgi:hypothetical protein
MISIGSMPPHRRLDAVQAEPVRRLLGVVDDVVELVGERVHVDRLERAGTSALGDMAQDLVGDAVALTLADEHVARQRGLIRKVGQEVAHQDRGLRPTATTGRAFTTPSPHR